jgi:hypothetical protein
MISVFEFSLALLPSVAVWHKTSFFFLWLSYFVFEIGTKMGANAKHKLDKQYNCIRINQITISCHSLFAKKTFLYNYGVYVAINYFPVVFQRENLAFPASIRIVLAPVPPKQK